MDLAALINIMMCENAISFSGALSFFLLAKSADVVHR